MTLKTKFVLSMMVVFMGGFVAAANISALRIDYLHNYNAAWWKVIMAIAVAAWWVQRAWNIKEKE